MKELIHTIQYIHVHNVLIRQVALFLASPFWSRLVNTKLKLE